MIIDNMRPRLLFPIIFIFILGTPFKSSLAQKSVAGQVYSDNWKKGHELFRHKDFGGARYCFQQVAAKEKEFSYRKIEAEFYLAYCAIELSRPEAEKGMLSFLDRYPGNAFVHQAFFQLGRQKYNQKKYQKALGWFERTDAYQIEKDQKDEFFFKKAYAYFKTDHKDEAGKYFFELLDKKGEYQLASNYYYAHIAYEKGNYQTALNAFDKLENDETYAPLIPYYISQIYYLQEKYDKLIAYAPRFLEKADVDRVPEIAKMIGLAYYNQKKYAEAIPYLIWDGLDLKREEIFALAFSYYQEKDYKNASQLFSKVKGKEDAMLQISTYNLADCFLKMGEKKEAKNAFEKASKMAADEDIKKSALFNFAKISYELSYSNANETISAFDAYLTQYPNSDENDEAYDFLVDVYMTTKSYKQALESMNMIKEKSPRIEEAYQRVAYFYALELFKQSKYVESLDYFNKALTYKIYNRDIAADCLYWKAEAYYRTEDYLIAIKNYQEFIQTPGVGNSKYFNNAYYNLGYCEFELDAYDKAIVWFRKYEQFMNGKLSEYLTDVQNRIGDCYFLNRNYEKAAEYYTKAAAANNWSTDYAVYQNALSRGLCGQLNEKITLLKNFSRKFPESDYKDDALFELAKAKVKQADEETALKLYKNLVSEYPQSEFIAKALLQLGQLNYNKKNYTEALKYYKQVVMNYSDSNDAQSALLGIKNVYIDMNDVQSYFAFTESLGQGGSVKTSERDSLTYLSAERLYMDGQSEKSTLAFSEYLEKFPQGLFRINAAYYKGEAAFNRKDFNNAVQAFEMVLNGEDNLYTEKALLGISQIYFEQKDYLKAKPYFELLKQKAEITDNKRIADWGLFRCNYELKDYTSLISESKVLLLLPNVTQDEKKEILYKRAKAYLALNNDSAAKDDLQILAKEVQSAEGAESRFLLADLLYRTQKIDEAEKRVNEFIDMNSPHHYWLGRSFILLSDIFVDKKDVFQARYTLQSVIDNYGIKDDGIIEAAKAKLEPILETVKPNENAQEKIRQDVSNSKANTKSIEKELKTKQEVKADSLSVNDAKSILNEMVGELDD
ncbi:tetratricopeptide repeat protein [Ancylomarina salipaludis]|uniref:Tetratricopeptide repeat protein n=1 Tax=Ancylomarina salipaludis TaxID=2501299 RepID=A0A4Q1JKU7_9BACT|nr:tetratricopeptide repeat protein [Ancylomarina salipaludis]RXQ93983.1 tetratricopeptide repeat protein [Ancylomarina salipaludis]